MIPWVFLILLFGVLGIRFGANPFGQGIEDLELASYDARVRFQGGVPFKSQDIAVITIDDSTFNVLGADPRTKGDSKWPFPNSFHKEVAEKLLKWGARAVVFDLLSFASPSRSRYSDEDAVFASMAADLGRVAISSKFRLTSGTSWAAGFQKTGMNSETWTIPAKAFKQIPHGFVNVQLDGDGSVRRFLPYYWRLSLFPVNCLAIEGLRLASFPGVDLPMAPATYSAAPPLRYFAFSDPRQIASEAISYPDVLLASETPGPLPGRVAGKVVFVGPTFTESHDFFTTPFSGKGGQELPTPGVFLHAMIANTFLNQYVIHRVSLKTERLIAFTFLLGGLIISWFLSPGPGFLALLMVILLYSGIVIAVFQANLLWLPIISPIFAAMGASIPNMALRLMVSEDKQVVIKKLFSMYVSPDVLKYVQTHPESLNLEGEKREATMFFSDLKGFTSISETMTPQKLSQIMNDYLTPMTEIIMEHRGYLDKYIGDAIMAVFGVPMPDSEHALHACQAAIKQQKCLKKLAAELEKTSGVKVSARMGVNTGTVSAGNMGSKDRFQYTVMGDAVNQASRFEGANKIFGSEIMIGEEAFLAAQDHIHARLLAYLTVKGKSKAVVVYELLEMKEGLDTEEDKRLTEFCAEFGDALSFFQKKDLVEARRRFGAFWERNKGDPPAEFYLNLCEEMLEEGIPSTFTGGIKLDSK